MYARMVRIQVPPEKMDDYIQLWHDQLLPFAKTQNGWRNAHLFVDREAGKTLIIGIWETEADARATGTQQGAHYQKQQAMVATLLGAPPVMEMEYFELAGNAEEERAVGG